jgi:hypothetical protein
VPLTEFQDRLARLLATNRTPDSYLAGGAALHIEPNSKRYSNDLDYFHDSETRVAEAYREDSALLQREGFEVRVDVALPGYVRAVVSFEDSSTKVEWAHDSAWRFLPTIRRQPYGFLLHPIDLATNKVLTLAGRDESRDFLDVITIHRELLPLGALCWAAVGKDPGFTPLSLLALLRRRGKYQPQELARLHLAEEVDLSHLKGEWLEALEMAEAFVRSRPPEEIGCLYFSCTANSFVQPAEGDPVVPHFGRPGGVLPRTVEPR